MNKKSYAVPPKNSFWVLQHYAVNPFFRTSFSKSPREISKWTFFGMSKPEKTADFFGRGAVLNRTFQVPRNMFFRKYLKGTVQAAPPML